jgi:hypothetical protein
MKKVTRKQTSIEYLVFILISLSLVSSVGASTHRFLPEQSEHLNPLSISTQDRTVAVAAIVKAEKANLRDRPAKSGSVVRTVNQGDLLALIDAIPIGAWYRVRDSKSDSEGWIHGNTIALLRTTDVAPVTATTVQRPRRFLPPVSGRSYVNVDGVRVPSPVFSKTKPDGSTARCRDGSYSFSQHRRGTCSYHGGVAEWY